MELNHGNGGTRRRRIWIALISAIVLLTMIAVWRSATAMKSMSAAAASEEQPFAQTAPGTKTKVVVEIGGAVPAGTIKGKLLSKKTEEIFTRTSTPVTAQFDAQTKIVMGKPNDLRPGAIVHVTGMIRGDHTIQAEQIVILTGYVQVQ